MTLSVYGATGIIGSYFSALFPCLPVGRERLKPRSKRVLYLISTTTNSTSTPWIDTDTNLTALMKRLDACRQAGVEEFNFVSSWFVYGRRETTMREDDNCFPHGIYSMTKCFAEELVIDYCASHGMKWRIFRLGNVYGGPDNGSMKRNALHFLINKLAINEPVVVIKEMCRDFIHIVDVCRAMYLLSNKAPHGQVFNIGSGRYEFLEDIVYEARDILGSQSEISSIHADGTEQSVFMALDCGKLHAAGFRPMIDFQQGLHDLCTLRRFSTPGHILTDKKLRQLLPV